ncbi:hypothetical protein AYL99_10105 [Fonsecaea erecta]|uniref:Uncharacterized protein n=1 Tax=Fonsecaea erecta TaxID=1367422 RepID=A0A178Z9S7_9EURO|nr:hypothetical protein AYL99_10105 [Fonsecaea erecta]OAP55953.1 hypothetical protein AYL99_10105 [Fonsecaea erecta]
MMTTTTTTSRPPPLRTALIGLSSSPTGYGWLNHFHLRALQARPDTFEIVAVLGSSPDSAQRAIATHGLSVSTVRAYGSPHDLAQDEAVEFAVVGVKVPLHRAVLVPSLLSDRSSVKGVFVEWPIGVSLAESEDIVRRTRDRGVPLHRTAVGLQGRFSAVTQRIAQLVRAGRVGRVLSTTVVGTVPTGGGTVEKRGVQYALDPANGATMVDIHLAHFVECLTFALGAEVATVSAQVRTMHPTTDIVDDLTGEVVEKDAPKRSPDQVLVQGLLRRTRRSNLDSRLRSDQHDEGEGGGAGAGGGGKGEEDDSVYSIHMRGGTSIAGGMTWLIYGTAGEMAITSPVHMIPHINVPAPWKIRTKTTRENDSKEEEVEEEEVSEQGPQGQQPAVARLWDAFVGAQEEEQQGSWPDFEHGLKIHRVVDAVWTSSRDGRVVEVS